MAAGTEESVGGESLVSHNRRPRTFRPGRLCRYEGCTTRLSIYNSDDYCSWHTGRDTERPALSLLAEQLKAENLGAAELGQPVEPAEAGRSVPEFQSEIAS